MTSNIGSVKDAEHTTTTETLTPAAVAALPDGELNELAAQVVMGWTKVIRDTPRPGGYAWAVNAEPGEKMDGKDGRITFLYHEWGPATDIAAAFSLVDMIVKPGNAVIFQFEQMPRGLAAAVFETDKGTPSYYRSIGESEHMSRARAITEAAVLAAMAMKEGE